VTLGHIGDVPKDYHSLAFRILIACPAALESEKQGGGVAQAKRWVSETFASYSIPAWSDEELEREASLRLQYQQQFVRPRKLKKSGFFLLFLFFFVQDVEVLATGRPGGPLCLMKSDPVASLVSLIPFSVQEHCEVKMLF